MKYWYYRVVKNICTKPSGTEEETLEIKEIYFDENNEPILVGDANIVGGSLEELKEVAKDFLSAFEKPVINYEDIVRKNYLSLFNNDEGVES